MEECLMVVREEKERGGGEIATLLSCGLLSQGVQGAEGSVMCCTPYPSSKGKAKIPEEVLEVALK